MVKHYLPKAKKAAILYFMSVNEPNPDRPANPGSPEIGDLEQLEAPKLFVKYAMGMVDADLADVPEIGDLKPGSANSTYTKDGLTIHAGYYVDDNIVDKSTDRYRYQVYGVTIEHPESKIEGQPAKRHETFEFNNMVSPGLKPAYKDVTDFPKLERQPFIPGDRERIKRDMEVAKLENAAGNTVLTAKLYEDLKVLLESLTPADLISTNLGPEE